MSDPNDYEDAVIENGDDSEETLNEIRKNLLDDFETAKTVTKDGSSGIGEREPVKVFLRVKPFTSKEIAEGESQGCLEMENTSTVLMHPPKTSFTYKQKARSGFTAETVHRHRFTFSRVFGPDTNQKAFFEETSLNFVKDFIDGQNCLVFSYGVTNAGKTYTILGNSQNLGILPRTIHILFNSFKDKNYGRANLKPKMFCDVVKLSSIQEEREESKKKMLLSLADIQTYHGSINNTDSLLQDTSCEQSNHEVCSPIDVSSILDVTSINVDNQGPIQFSVWLSFAEIYNEHVFDLLEPISMGKDGKRTVLKVGDDRKGNPYIKGLTEIHVNNSQEAMKLLKIGRKNQKIASTKLNENSSRSHCIFTFKILRVINNKEPHVARVSRLSFVDLAGSERYTKTQNTGERLKEAGNINTSIMTLGKCVELLRYNQSHTHNQKNIPFRESKLTRLFQGFFCGKGKASMIVNVNQCASAFDETLHALKFSALAKKVTTMVQEMRPLPQPEAPVAARSTRKSVMWADGSLSTPAGNKARTEQNDTQLAPLAEEEESRIQGHSNQDLLAFINVLQGQLIEGKKNMALMEVKIREEVCHEMAEQMVEIEDNYIERLKEDQRINEDLYEKRMDLLTKSVKKSRKRPRIECIEDEDDEWVSSVFLHKEQVKVKEMSEQISSLEQKLKIMEDERREMNDQNEKMESLIRTVKDYKIELETKTSQLMEAKKVQGGRPAMSSTTATDGNLIKQLEKRLDETTVALDKKNSQLINKNNIIVKLEKSLKDVTEHLKGKEKEMAELRMEKELSASEMKKSSGNEIELRKVNEELKEKESLLVAKIKEIKEITENLKFVEEEVKVLESKDKESQKELEEMKGEMKVNKNKMENLNKIIDELKKQETEVQETNKGLQENFEKALADLANVQATVNIRNEKLEQYEIVDKSLKDAYRDKESEMMKMKREVEEARNELREKENAMEQVKELFEKQMAQEIIKVNEEWESVTERLKAGLKQQEDVFAQMDLDLATKRDELSNIGEENEKLIRNISDKNEKIEKSKQEKEHMEDQKERLKIKVFELETEVEKLQQEVKKEALKKDTATQALKDGLAIVKSKKKEYEEKTKALTKEKATMKGTYEKQVTALQDEITRLKSVDSESCTDEKINSSSEKEGSSESDNIYKPVQVESFNLTNNDRVEIDVTPITGSGLKSAKNAKIKALKRKSSDLSLKEIKDQINSTKKKSNKDFSEDDFTPVSVTRLRKTRTSSVSGRSRQSKAHSAVSPSSFSLFTLDENSENTNPLVLRTQQNSQKSASGKRRFFNKLGIPESGKSKTEKDIPVKKRRRKLLKKNEISAPFSDSPLSKTDKEETADRTQQIITRHLRSRVVKGTR